MEPTPSQTVGPFFGFALPFEDDASCVPAGIRIEGQVFDGAGEPVTEALLEVSHADQFGRCRTDDEGAFHFTVRAAPYLEVTVFARGLLRHLQTRMYFPDSQADAVLGLVAADRRSTLIAHQDGDVLRFDIHLQGVRETVFFSSKPG